MTVLFNLFNFLCRRVLEIGGGSSGLCGLGLASYSDIASICITDGHPECLSNQLICRQMCKQKGILNCPVVCHRLRWSRLDEFQELSQVTNAYTTKFDMVIGADVLFFRDFHLDLIHVLQQGLEDDGV